MAEMSYLAHPQLDHQEIKYKWHVGYHDGPLSGICEYRGQRYWFTMCDAFTDTYSEVGIKWYNAKTRYLITTEDELDNGLNNNPQLETEWYEYWSLLGLNSWRRRYIVQELSPEQLQDEEYWHALFRQYVGNHTDYEENVPRRLQPQSERQKFYSLEKERKKQDYSQNKIIGWYER